MKIIFDLRQVGLGDNGGSLTLIKCANTLFNLGHEVIIIDTGRNQHSWTKLNTPHLICNSNDKIPDADVIIATGYKSVPLTCSAPKRCGIKLHYIRGWETWQYPEQQIYEKILKTPTIKIVNSICLKNKLKQYKVDSTIIRPGYDLEDLYPMNIRNKKSSFVLGGLYTKGKHEKIKRTQWIFDTAKYFKNKYPNVKLIMFGNSELKNNLVDEYYYKPSMQNKNKFFNLVDVWLAPVMQEGLHMPPAEAMLTGCPVVATNAEMSGTQDYVISGVTGIVTKNIINSFIEGVDSLYQNAGIRKDIGILAREKILELGSREENMKKFINFLESIK